MNGISCSNIAPRTTPNPPARRLPSTPLLIIIHRYVASSFLLDLPLNAHQTAYIVVFIAVDDDVVVAADNDIAFV